MTGATPLARGREAVRRALRRQSRRAGRRTNVALLIMLVGAFVSGWVAFANGQPTPASVTTALHGLFGVAVVLLLPWKSMIIGRAPGLRVASLLLLILVVGCLVAGFVEVFVGFVVIAGVSPIQVHVGAALLAIPLLAWHVGRSRRQRLRPADLSRRGLLRASGLALGTAAGYALLAGAAGWSNPTRPRAATGSRPVDPDAIPATIWLFDSVPQLTGRDHRVLVDGRSVSATELAGGGAVRARLDCTSGWYADAEWGGTRLSDLLTPEGLAAGQSVVVRSVTGYSRSFPTAEASSLWLAVTCQDRPLLPGTGAPVRLVAPGRRGFWWVKWVASVEISPEPSWRQLPVPAQ